MVSNVKHLHLDNIRSSSSPETLVHKIAATNHAAVVCCSMLLWNEMMSDGGWHL